MKVQKRNSNSSRKGSLTLQQLTRLAQQRGTMLVQAARPLSFGAAAAASTPRRSSSASYVSVGYTSATSPAMSTGSNHHSPSTPSERVSMPPPPTPAESFASSSSSRDPPKRSPSPHNIKQLVETLSHHRVNTVTELCRIERIAASCTSPEDARAFQGPMTRAWVHCVTSNQLLSELRGLTRGYPFSAELVQEAHQRVRADPQSNRSWNLAWLCLVRIRDDGLISAFSVLEASKPSMWGGLVPSEEDVLKLSGCFSREWTLAVSVMLKHWPAAPAWY